MPMLDECALNENICTIMIKKRTRKERKAYPLWVRNVIDRHLRRVIETEYLIDRKFARELSKCPTMADMMMKRGEYYNSRSSLSSSLFDDEWNIL